MPARRVSLNWTVTSLALFTAGSALAQEIYVPVCQQDAKPEIVSFKVMQGLQAKKGTKGSGRLLVANATLFYCKAGQSQPELNVSCQSALKPTVDQSGLRVGSVYWFLPDQEGLTTGGLLQEILGACRTQEARAEAELKAVLEANRERAEAERQQAEAATRSALRDGILAALRAAEDPDPFAAIRGDFDLSASDSHQWKTSLKLPDAEKCGLIKTPPSTSTSASSWTFACMFRNYNESYEGMVKSMQSVLNLPYQPDERAVNINQVFFADPSKPARRVFVSKINESTIGVSVVAVRLAGVVPTVPNAASFSGVPTVLSTQPVARETVLPTEPTVRDEVERIHSGPYKGMPPAQRVSASAVSGSTTMTVQNSTAYELSVFFDGPVSKKLTLAPSASQDVELASGTFHVAGRVAATNVLPFYGEDAYEGSAHYSVTFYIGR